MNPTLDRWWYADFTGNEVVAIGMLAVIFVWIVYDRLT